MSSAVCPLSGGALHSCCASPWDGFSGTRGVCPRAPEAHLAFQQIGLGAGRLTARTLLAAPSPPLLLPGSGPVYSCPDSCPLASSCGPRRSRMACGFSLSSPRFLLRCLCGSSLLPGVCPHGAPSDCHPSTDSAAPLGSDFLPLLCLRSASVLSVGMGQEAPLPFAPECRWEGKAKPHSLVGRSRCVREQGRAQGCHGSFWGPVSAP